jgi:ligand-binding SRPBCC domain-containing protein
MTRPELSRTTPIAAPAEQVWERVTSPEGINHELRPWMRMTMPRRLRGATLDDLPLDETIGRSWILLFGVVPFDYDDLMLVEREPGRFRERSAMMSMRVWEHERSVRATGEGSCEITDRMAFELRAPLAALRLGRPIRAMIARLVAHRHRRLAKYFASGLPPA